MALTPAELLTLRVQAALAALPETLRHEYMLAMSEHKAPDYEAAAEDAVLVASALVAELTEGVAAGPRLVVGEGVTTVPDDMVVMPACATGRRKHYPNLQGRCTGCGIDIEAVRGQIRRNAGRLDARARRAKEHSA